MYEGCLVIRFIFSFIGMYDFLRFVWIEVEKMQFGADVLANSWADSVVCAIVSIALNLFFLYGELDG